MSSSKKAFFGLLAGIVAIIAAGAFGYYFFKEQLVAVGSDVGTLKAEQQTLKEQIKIYEDTKKKIEELDFVKELANSVLPISKEQANVVSELKNFVAQSGLTLQSITFTGQDPKASVETTQTEAVEGLTDVRVLPAEVIIEAGADYGQILSLLRTIEKNQRKMQITDISLTPNRENKNTFSATTMSINIYLRSK